MNQRDLTLLGGSIIISIALSLIVAKFVFSKPSNLNQTVDVVQSISADFPAPDPKYINNQSIDPTQIVSIGPNNNQKIFNPPSN